MPRLRRPLRSAPSIIASAMRSLYDPVGLKYSSLTTTSAHPGETRRRSRTTGVRPIVSRTELTGSGGPVITAEDLALIPLHERGTRLLALVVPLQAQRLLAQDRRLEASPGLDLEVVERAAVRAQAMRNTGRKI